MRGETGGDEEEQAAEYAREHVGKPVIRIPVPYSNNGNDPHDDPDGLAHRLAPRKHSATRRFHCRT